MLGRSTEEEERRGGVKNLLVDLTVNSLNFLSTL